MNLGRGTLRGGGLLHPKSVVRVAVRQGPCARLGPARGEVGLLHKTRKTAIGRQHVHPDGVKQLLPNAGLVLRRQLRKGELRERASEWGVLRLFPGDGLGLRQYLFKQEARRRPAIVDPGLD